MENNETTLEYIKRKLSSKAFNNSKAARATGLSSATLSGIVTGKRANPSFKVVQKLHDYFRGLEK